DDRVVPEQPTGKVEGDLERRASPDRAADLDADPPHDVARQPADEAARLHQRNEGMRQNQRAIRLAPAHQHFRAAQLAGANVDNGLVVRDELPGRKTALDLGYRILRPAT